MQLEEEPQVLRKLLPIVCGGALFEFEASLDSQRCTEKAVLKNREEGVHSLLQGKG